MLAFLSLATFFFGALVSSPAHALSDTSLYRGIQRCADVDRTELFSCYRAQIEHYASRKTSPEVAASRARTLTLSFSDSAEAGEPYGILGTDCHTFMHALGDFVATTFPSRPLEEQLHLGNGSCTAGFTMGLYKRRAYLEQYASEQLLRDFFTQCYPGSEEWCAHEIGHVLHDEYVTPILSVIDPISARYGLSVPEPPSMLTEPDLQRPFTRCRELLPAAHWNDCFIGVGHNMFLFGEFNPKGFQDEIARCEGIKAAEDKHYCRSVIMYRIGVHYGAPLYLSSEFAKAADTCARGAEGAPKISQGEAVTSCYLGIGAGLGLQVAAELGETYALTPELLVLIELCEYAGVHAETCYRGAASKSEFINAFVASGLRLPGLERALTEMNQ